MRKEPFHVFAHDAPNHVFGQGIDKAVHSQEDDELEFVTLFEFWILVVIGVDDPRNEFPFCLVTLELFSCLVLVDRIPLL